MTKYSYYSYDCKHTQTDHKYDNPEEEKSSKNKDKKDKNGRMYVKSEAKQGQISTQWSDN